MLLNGFFANLFLIHSFADVTDAQRLADSAAKWKVAREMCGNSYQYKVVRSSFTGARSETTIVVRSGKVIERRLEASKPPIPGAPAKLETEWVEKGAEIGTHKSEVEPRTVDELYAIAGKLVEASVPANHVRSLGIDKNGLLHHCFLRDKRIADDAPITGFGPIELDLRVKP
jgi:hypothetical protein